MSKSVRCNGENKFFKQCPLYIVYTALTNNTQDEINEKCYCWEHAWQNNLRSEEIKLELNLMGKLSDQWRPLGAFMTNNNLFFEGNDNQDYNQNDDQDYNQDYNQEQKNKRLEEIANDDQNVHTPEIQSNVNDAIRRLEKWAKNKKPYKDLSIVVIQEADLENEIHIQAIDHIRHCYLWSDDTQMFSITYPQLATWVWERVTRPSENRDILIERFFEEVQESKGQCLNGNMARLMNVFAAIDPEMSPQSDDIITKEQLQYMIASTIKLPTVQLALQEAQEILERARLPKEEWNDWLESIKESFI